LADETDLFVMVRNQPGSVIAGILLISSLVRCQQEGKTTAAGTTIAMFSYVYLTALLSAVRSTLH